MGLVVRDSIEGRENALWVCWFLTTAGAGLLVLVLVLKMFGFVLEESKGAFWDSGVDSTMRECRSDDSAGESRIEDRGGRETVLCLVCFSGVSVIVAAIDIAGVCFSLFGQETGDRRLGRNQIERSVCREKKGRRRKGRSKTFTTGQKTEETAEGRRVVSRSQDTYLFTYLTPSVFDRLFIYLHRAVYPPTLSSRSGPLPCS